MTRDDAIDDDSPGAKLRKAIEEYGWPDPLDRVKIPTGWKDSQAPDGWITPAPMLPPGMTMESDGMVWAEIDGERLPVARITYNPREEEKQQETRRRIMVDDMRRNWTTTRWRKERELTVSLRWEGLAPGLITIDELTDRVMPGFWSEDWFVRWVRLAGLRDKVVAVYSEETGYLNSEPRTG